MDPVNCVCDKISVDHISVHAALRSTAQLKLVLVCGNKTLFTYFLAQAISKSCQHFRQSTLTEENREYSTRCSSNLTLLDNSSKVATTVEDAALAFAHALRTARNSLCANSSANTCDQVGFLRRLGELLLSTAWPHSLGAGAEQPFSSLKVQNRQAMQFMGRSMDWTLEENMVDGLFFYATLTGRRGGPGPFVQAGTVKPEPRCSWRGHSRMVGADVGDESTESRSVVQPLHISTVTTQSAAALLLSDELMSRRFLGRVESDS